MNKGGIITAVLLLWIFLLCFSVVSNHALSISRLTTILAMFASGSVFMLYVIIATCIDCKRTRQQVIADYFNVFGVMLCTVGYFIYCFFVPQYNYNYSYIGDMLHEICRIMLNCGTIIYMLFSALDRFLIAIDNLKFCKSAKIDEEE